MDAVLQALEEIAPLRYAADWDNVGLLVEPAGARPYRRVFLTVDLTERVLEEALDERTDLIVAYHPPLFEPLRTLRRGDPRQGVLLRAIEAGVSIYSPHTALDAAPGGVNDWLAEGLGEATCEPIEPLLGAEDSVPGAGQGRRGRLLAPAPIEVLVERVKKHLGLEQVRLSLATRHREGARVESFALCAGSGGSVIESCAADLYLTGEMHHHPILAAAARGTSVIVTDHTNTERGYLPRLRDWLRSRAGDDVQVAISLSDRDPLRIV